MSTRQQAIAVLMANNFGRPKIIEAFGVSESTIDREIRAIRERAETLDDERAERLRSKQSVAVALRHAGNAN